MRARQLCRGRVPSLERVFAAAVTAHWLGFCRGSKCTPARVFATAKLRQIIPARFLSWLIFMLAAAE